MMYKAVSAVWEVTMGCNMRCKHCGSSCENTAKDELTTEEAILLCDDLGKLGLKFVTLSGGEPTTRKDWPLIAKGLRKNNIIPTMITNGWLLNEDIIDKAIECRVNTIAISIDGLRETHDFMRREGSFDRDIKGLELMKSKDMRSSVITTINKKNLSELEELKNLFIEKGVCSWQLQFGLPMGNLHNNSELVIDPEDINKIIDFAYKNKDNGVMRIDLADCLGYYNLKEIEVRKIAHKNAYLWNGCNAGKYTMGILCNGDILGCTSIRNREFIEGNIRERSIVDIWNDPNSFKWSREMKKTKLKGTCSKCRYGSVCLGGCSNTRLCMNDDIYSENKYCSYNLIIDKKKKDIESVTDVNILYTTALELVEKNQFQIAELLIDRAIRLGCSDKNIIALNGFVHYKLENYEESKLINEKLLELNSKDAYANKGLGLNLCKLGEVEKGLNYLERAIELCSENDMDPYYDLAITLIENDKKDRAREVLEIAKSKSEEFYNRNIELYKLVS